jgi:ABC-type nitrate/sulfonate/bicarbonate transport system permease component
MSTVFWAVLAALYLTLAIVTWIKSKSVKKALYALAQPGDSLTSYSDELKKEVGLESTLHAAYKAIIGTEIAGFVLAAIAAIVSGLC